MGLPFRSFLFSQMKLQNLGRPDHSDSVSGASITRNHLFRSGRSDSQTLSNVELANRSDAEASKVLGKQESFKFMMLGQTIKMILQNIENHISGHHRPFFLIKGTASKLPERIFHLYTTKAHLLYLLNT